MTNRLLPRNGLAMAVLLILAGALGCGESRPSEGGQGGQGRRDDAAGTGGALALGGMLSTGGWVGVGGAGGAVGDSAADQRAAVGAERREIGSDELPARDAVSANGGVAGAGAGGAAGAGGNRDDGGLDSRLTRDFGTEPLADASDRPVDVAIEVPPASDSGPPSSNLVPAQGALLGMYFGNGTMAATESLVGRKVALHLVYYAWDDDWTRGTTKSDLDGGRIPLVNWEPDGIDFNKIVDGSLDATVNARATGAKALARPFFLDFAAESNGDEAWSGNNAALYVSAYRHIHDRFVAAGATNVVWAWCPNVTDTDGSNKTTMDYYPGDDYVDWTCVDGYNWGGGDWQTFAQVFARIYPLLATKQKPILIGEMASSATGGDKAAWIDGILPTLKSSYPLIKGLVWFDVNKEEDWRIDSSSETLAAFKRMAADPYLNP